MLIGCGTVTSSFGLKSIQKRKKTKRCHVLKVMFLDIFCRCSRGVRRVFGGCSGGVRFVLCCCVIPVFGPFSPHVRFGICFRPIQWMPWMFGHGNVQNAYSACRESMFFTKSSWISTFSSRNAGFSKFLKILDFETFQPDSGKTRGNPLPPKLGDCNGFRSHSSQM